MPSHPDYQQHNPSRTPDWRWERACHLRREGVQLSPVTDDELTLRAVKYLIDLGSDRRPANRLKKRHPDLHAAHRLYEDKVNDVRHEIEARILARQTTEEVAAATGLKSRTVAAYEAYFFDVRDRLNATDWLACRVLGPGHILGYSKDEVTSIWKQVGFIGGPLVLDVFLAATSERHDASRYPASLIGRARRLVRANTQPAALTYKGIDLEVVLEGRRKRKPSRSRATPPSLAGTIAEIKKAVEGPSSAKQGSPASGRARSSREGPAVPASRGATRS